MTPLLLNALLVTILLLNLFALGTGRIRAIINAAAMQGAVLGLLAGFGEGRITTLGCFVAIATIALKGLLIPRILRKALRDAQIKREVEPIIGLKSSMILGAIGTAVAIALAARLPLENGATQTLIVPASFSTVFTGFILLTTRSKAISQVIGYLILENGIFIFGLLLLQAMPFLVEVGVLLDVTVGIFVISIIIHHINEDFASLDTRRLSALKE
jgi:hydrogenase-4 component E